MGRKRNYTIYTLNARELMRLCSKKDGCIDFNITYDREKVLKVENRFAESALFYQVIKVALESGDERPEREIMTKSLVYLDFERDISDVKEETEELLSKGFKLRFKGDDDYTGFIPFDKSASMSRECKMSFISEVLFDRLDEALDMGFRDSQEHFPSKYYAYRGLYMTDGIGVDPSRLKLNERTVVVLKTKKERPAASIGITVPATINKNGRIEVTADVSSEPKDLEQTLYDGEGLVSPEYAEEINRLIPRGRGREANSFQIRMPYTKGMLHKANFKRFISDQFPDADIDSMEITDYFGIKRSLKDAEIILTDSMFKCVKWLEKMFGIFDENNETDEPKLIGVKSDPLKYYFDNFRKHDHALYIANTNTGIRGNKYVKMNYQFFNTLDLSKEAFERIVNNHIDSIESILIEPEKGREAMLNMDDYADSDSIDSERVKRMSTWEYALLKNEGFARDPMIRKRIRQAAKGQVRDVLEGRVNVRGSVKYLSGDLMKLLIKLAEDCGAGEKEEINNLKRQCLLPDRFYTCGIASGDTGILDPNKYYGILRSPHLSRNEQCALRPYTSQLYADYFGNLNGVVMVSDLSDAPIAMSGADFDGDMVKIIMDEDINEAILKTVYEPDDERGADAHGVIGYRRKLPVPVIKSPRGESRLLGRHISYEDLRASFAGRVGHISNLAIRIAKMEYANSGKSAVPENSAALCTIATGLEIDAVKNGAAPDITYLESLCKGSKDVYLSIHNDMKNETDKDRAVHVTYDEDADEYTASFKYRAAKKKDKNLFNIKGSQQFNIDFLPYFYAKALHDGIGKGRIKFNMEGIPDYCFMFELYDNWRENALSDPRIDKLKGIIGAYRKLKADSWNIGMAEKRYSEGSLRGRIVTLLDVEYDIGTDRLYRSDEYIEEALESAYQSMYEIVRDEKFADEAIKLITNLNWQYSPTFEEKVELLQDIIGTTELPLDALEILCDTYDNGYQFLNYILRDVKELRKIGELNIISEEDEDSETTSVGIRSPWKKAYDKDVFKRIYAEYRSYYTRTDYSKTDWLSDAGTICRDEVLKLFDGDIDKAIECTVALDKEIDEGHAFLWNVFEIDDFKYVLYDNEDKRLIDVK